LFYVKGKIIKLLYNEKGLWAISFFILPLTNLPKYCTILSMSKKRILVADDQEEILSLLKDSLTTSGFDVTLCKESKNILQAIKTFHPDLILLDLLMPELGGFEICEILNNDPLTRGIPIIIVSGFGDLVDVKKAYNLGVVGYFVKPFSLNDLTREINKAIANKEQAL